MFMKRQIAAAIALGGLLGACGDDGPTTLAQGEDVEVEGDQTLDISAEEEDGDVTGEVVFTDSVNGRQPAAVVTIECADTDTDGVVILGGEITSSRDDPDWVGALVAMVIREGDPDSWATWLDEGEHQSCSDLLEDRHEDFDDDSAFVDVEDGSNIEIG